MYTFCSSFSWYGYLTNPRTQLNLFSLLWCSHLSNLLYAFMILKIQRIKWTRLSGRIWQSICMLHLKWQLCLLLYSISTSDLAISSFCFILLSTTTPFTTMQIKSMNSIWFSIFLVLYCCTLSWIKSGRQWLNDCF